MLLKLEIKEGSLARCLCGLKNQFQNPCSDSKGEGVYLLKKLYQGWSLGSSITRKAVGHRIWGNLGHLSPGTGRDQHSTTDTWVSAWMVPVAAVCSSKCCPDLCVRSAPWILLIECGFPTALWMCRRMGDPKCSVSQFSSNRWRRALAKAVITVVQKKLSKLLNSTAVEFHSS